jgi:hypothetical protein
MSLVRDRLSNTWFGWMATLPREAYVFGNSWIPASAGMTVG